VSVNDRLIYSSWRRTHAEPASTGLVRELLREGADGPLLTKKRGRSFQVRGLPGATPGNYLGAIQNYVALQDDTSVYCIVDLHALTTVEDTINLRQKLTHDAGFPGRRHPARGIDRFYPVACPQLPSCHAILS